MIKEQSIFLEKIQKEFESDSEVQQEALKMLVETGLPNKKSEAYKYTPISKFLEKKADLSLNQPATFNENDRYNTEGSHLVIKNGRFSSEDSIIEEGLKVRSAKISKGKHDPLSLINTVLSKEEIHIQASGNLSPIFIYQINSIGFSNPRIKVASEKNQELTLVEKSINLPGTFINSYIEFDVAANARINFSKVQAYSSDVIAHETVFVKQSRDSRFFVNTFSFSGEVIRNNVTINLEGENCEGHMHGLYLLNGNTHVDNNTSVDHIKPNSYSNEVYKGILDEKSTGVFNGKIYVRPDAQKTNAFQSNNNILLSDDATINTKPQLEIWADDVKCSHGCTTGQMDEDAIFYLRARGIDEKTAKGMILNAFASQAMEKVPVVEVQEELMLLIQKNLY
ncbi:MAG: Fe-S cluster assembly protein SufD [Cyclobacteriaceae bacterium]